MHRYVLPFLQYSVFLSPVNLPIPQNDVSHTAFAAANLPTNDHPAPPLAEQDVAPVSTFLYERAADSDVCLVPSTYL